MFTVQTTRIAVGILNEIAKIRSLTQQELDGISHEKAYKKKAISTTNTAYLRAHCSDYKLLCGSSSRVKTEYACSINSLVSSTILQLFLVGFFALNKSKKEDLHGARLVSLPWT